MIVWSSLFSRTSAWFSLTSSLTCESSVAGVPLPAAASWALVRRRLLVVLGDLGLFPPRLTGVPAPRTVYSLTGPLASTHLHPLVATGTVYRRDGHLFHN